MSHASQCCGLRASSRARKPAGFTLVELLVVIGIIALLMSILMPSLGRARASPSLVSCESNFKQIYMALGLSANENKGVLPAASWVDNKGNPIWGATGTAEQTFVMLSQIMGTRIDDPTKDPLNPVFVCREAPQDAPAVWAPTVIRQVQFHPRGFPGYDQLSWDYTNNIAQGKPAVHPLRKLAQIRNSSDKIAFWEGAALPRWNVTSEPESISLDTWRSSAGTWGHAFYDPNSASWDFMDRNPDLG